MRRSTGWQLRANSAACLLDMQVIFRLLTVRFVSYPSSVRRKIRFFAFLGKVQAICLRCFGESKKEFSL